MPSNLVKTGREMVTKAALQVAGDTLHGKDDGFKNETGAKQKAKRDKKKQKRDDIEELVRIAAAGIGFVSEVVKHRKEMKKWELEQDSNDDHQSNDTSISKEANEAPQIDRHTSDHSVIYREDTCNQSIWDLDDAIQGELSHPPETQSTSSSESHGLAAAFLTRHHSQPDPEHIQKLALPVVIPQRRPKHRARGFVRAYAPTMASVGIDQETFLDLVDTFNESLQASPWLHVINIAGLAGTAAPEPLSMLIGLGAQMATDMAMEVQSRFRSNAFLNRINTGFLAPRGLTCIVATWNSNASEDEIVTVVDFSKSSIESRFNANPIRHARAMKDEGLNNTEALKKVEDQMQDVLQPAHGVFQGSEFAPLIVPSAEKKRATRGEPGGDRGKKNVFDRGEAWLDDYMDKATRARWIEENADLPVTNIIPKPEFRSRYANPAHPAASGDIVAFFTGGRWQYRNQKPREDKERNIRSDDKYDIHGDELHFNGSRGERPHLEREASGKASGWKHLFQKVGETVNHCAFADCPPGRFVPPHRQSTTVEEIRRTLLQKQSRSVH
ncbi:hypothetical protein N0V90_010373 [Kalmusia sp. IMI 367209]|nr:hypothetical protein N0V90_010373 [Kalmusia sp. IMI 367209]